MLKIFSSATKCSKDPASIGVGFLFRLLGPEKNTKNKLFQTADFMQQYT
jgi:hypothetical protein